MTQGGGETSHVIQAVSAQEAAKSFLDCLDTDLDSGESVTLYVVPIANCVKVKVSNAITVETVK